MQKNKPNDRPIVIFHVILILIAFAAWFFIHKKAVAITTERDREYSELMEMVSWGKTMPPRQVDTSGAIVKDPEDVVGFLSKKLNEAKIDPKWVPGGIPNPRETRDQKNVTTIYTIRMSADKDNKIPKANVLDFIDRVTSAFPSAVLTESIATLDGDYYKSVELTYKVTKPAK